MAGAALAVRPHTLESMIFVLSLHVGWQQEAQDLVRDAAKWRDALERLREGHEESVKRRRQQQQDTLQRLEGSVRTQIAEKDDEIKALEESLHAEKARSGTLSQLLSRYAARWDDVPGGPGEEGKETGRTRRSQDSLSPPTSPHSGRNGPRPRPLPERDARPRPSGVLRPTAASTARSAQARHIPTSPRRVKSSDSTRPARLARDRSCNGSISMSDRSGMPRHHSQTKAGTTTTARLCSREGGETGAGSKSGADARSVEARSRRSRNRGSAGQHQRDGERDGGGEQRQKRGPTAIETTFS